MKIAVGFACLLTVAVLEVVIGAPGGETVPQNDNLTEDDQEVADDTAVDTNNPLTEDDPEVAANTVVDTNNPLTEDDPEVTADTAVDTNDQVTADVTEVAAETAGDTNALSPCEVARGVCQPMTKTCDGGELLKHKSYCGSGKPLYCCIPPGCVYGSKALRNGAIIKRGCTELKCEQGIMKKDDSECQNQAGFIAECEHANGLLLNDRCFFSNFNQPVGSNFQASWTNASHICDKLKVNTRKPHLPLKLASFKGITDTISVRFQGTSFWTGGSDTTAEDSWKWLDGKIIKATSIHDGCLSVEYEPVKGFVYTDKPCYKKDNYICELPNKPTDCTCNKNNNGCTLRSPTMPDLACQCKIVGGECKGAVVSCKDPDSLACKHPGTGFEHCMQGVFGHQGNCCGYAASKCYYGL